MYIFGRQGQVKFDRDHAQTKSSKIAIYGDHFLIMKLIRIKFEKITKLFTGMPSLMMTLLFGTFSKLSLNLFKGSSFVLMIK